MRVEKNKRGRLLNDDCDLFVFVAMDTRRILFIHPMNLGTVSKYFHVSDLSEEMCELSRANIKVCLGEP